MADAASPDPAVTTWTLGEELGRGALGRVVRVHGDDGRVLAGKLLHHSHRGDARAELRFDAEARLLAGVRHANLVGIHGVVAIGDERVLLMDLVDGPSLATLIARSGSVPAERAVRIARGIAAGLAEAHRRGVVHRDLKPANVLLAGDDTPRIVDFGLARAAALTGVAAGDLVVVGTPAYMSPEGVDPMAIDGRSDLYALGCILFEMLTGAPPFAGATSIATLEAHRHAPRPPLPGVAPELVRLVHALLAPAPADRPPSAQAVERALADHTALAPVPAAGAASACTRCGAPLVRAVPVCFACCAPQLGLGAGEHTVFVTGPGALTHKLDAGLRAHLIAWIDARPGLGLSSVRLAKSAPRLPFVLAGGLDAEGARGLVEAMVGLGLEARAVQGGRFALPELRKKTRQMSMRYLGIWAVSGWQAVTHMGVATIPVAIMGLLGSTAVAVHMSSRPVLERGERAALPQLGAALATSLARIAPVVQALQEERHRDALRGVVVRALGVGEVVPAAEAQRIDADLARVVDLALVAAARLDELERGVDPARLAGGDPALREQLRERDRLAAYLLDLTAQLDALRARWAAQRGPDASADAALAELRGHLDALDELRGRS
jgi:hypothetical protein